MTPNPHTRQSNMELLRILSMLLVVLVHTGYYSLGRPTAAEVQADPLSQFSLNFFQALATGCVDLFILLTGYFGIKRPTIKGAANLLFQCAFYSIGICAVMFLTGAIPFTWATAFRSLLITRGYWFINSYLCLYLLSPLLNRLIERSPRKRLRNILIGFFALQTAIVWGLNIGNFFIGGYSLSSFMSLYLLARYIRIYGGKWFTLPRMADLALVLSLPLVIALLATANYYFEWDFFGDDVKYKTDLYSYINPLVLVGSVCLMLFCSKLSFQSKGVNLVAASCLAVYLVHLNPLVSPYFRVCVQTIHEEFHGMTLAGMIFVLIVGIYAASVLMDQLRIRLWLKLSSRFPILH